MPFWVSVVLALAGMAYFSFFLEAVFLFFLSDLIYGTPEPKLFYTVFVSFFISFLFLIFVEFLKKRLKYYP